MDAVGDRTRVLKGGLLFVGILILGGVMVMFIRNGQQPVSDGAGAAPVSRNATIALEGVHHTEIRNGVKSWELDAEDADYLLEENRAYLSTLRGTFFRENGERVFLSADSGTLMTGPTDSNDLEVSGNVVLKNSQCEMQTDRLIFNEKDKIFYTESLVTIRYLSLTQVAEQGMTYSLDTGTIDGGGIKGNFENGNGL